MGVNIHAYIDYDEGNETHNLARIFIKKNDWLFILMSGAKGQKVQDQFPISSPKGLPPKMSWRVCNDAYLSVIDASEPVGQRCCTRANAEKWGRYTDESKRFVHHPDWHSHTWLVLTEVDEIIRRYSLLKEQKQKWIQSHEPVPDGYKLADNQEWSDVKVVCSESKTAKIPMELVAIRDMMKAVEANGNKCRLILWFDS